MAATDRSKDMRFHQIDEGQVLVLGIIQADECLRSLQSSCHWVEPSRNPTAQRRFGHAQIMRGLSYQVGRSQSSINATDRDFLPQTLSTYYVCRTSRESGRVEKIQPADCNGSKLRIAAFSSSNVCSSESIRVTFRTFFTRNIQMQQLQCAGILNRVAVAVHQHAQPSAVDPAYVAHVD